MTHSSNVNIIAEHNEQQSRRQQQPWRAENLTRPGAFGAVEFEFDESIGTLWCYMSPTGDPHVSPALLADLGKAQAAIRAGVLPEQSGPHPLIRTMVLASRMPGVYSLGGDLRMFADCIQQQNRTLLRDYAHRCVDIVFNHSEGYGQGLTTFSLVQGQALADLLDQRSDVEEADELEQILAADDLRDTPTPELARLRRYELALHKRLQWLMIRLPGPFRTADPLVISTLDPVPAGVAEPIVEDQTKPIAPDETKPTEAIPDPTPAPAAPQAPHHRPDLARQARRDRRNRRQARRQHRSA